MLLSISFFVVTSVGCQNFFSQCERFFHFPETHKEYGDDSTGTHGMSSYSRAVSKVFKYALNRFFTYRDIENSRVVVVHHAIGCDINCGRFQ